MLLSGRPEGRLTQTEWQSDFLRLADGQMERLTSSRKHVPPQNSAFALASYHVAVNCMGDNRVVTRSRFGLPPTGCGVGSGFDWSLFTITMNFKGGTGKAAIGKFVPITWIWLTPELTCHERQTRPLASYDSP